MLAQDVPLRELGVTNLSDMRLNQSYGAFYSAIDGALEAEGIARGKVLRCQNLFRHFTRNSDDYAKWRALNLLMEIVTPAYMCLREQGYTHYDLTQ